jgi:hypothetical protein
MKRRDVGKVLLAAAAAGSAVVAEKAQAQSCVAPCHAITAAETAAGSVVTNTSFPPGDVRRYGGIGDGIVNDTSAIQAAHNQAKQPRGARPFLPAGQWKITTAINPSQLGMYGEGSKFSLLKCQGCQAFQIPSNAGWDRPAAVFELFGIDSLGNSCDGLFAFHFPGVAPGATAVYNSGFTVRDIEIGRMGRFGGGFFLKDVFRANIENVGLTDVSCMIQIVGSVCQCKFRNVTSNNDNAGTTMSRYGISTSTATYASGVGVCENIVFTDCAYIRGNRGIEHQAGAHVEFINFDCETSSIGANINAECYMHGGIVAPSPGTTSWVGIRRGVNPSVSYDGTIFDCVDVNTLNALSQPFQSYGFDLGDQVSPVHGVIIRGCRIRGTPSSMADGIRGAIVRDATIEDNFFETGCFAGTAINLAGRRLFVNRNRVPGGTVSVQDGGDALACGEITYNECTTLMTTLVNPSRWTIRNF